ncbi:hypothetical protein NGTWS0302_09710 [Mycolicibacterium cyprinidarum]|uniref:Uncharacterized protein n=1 Tax=Mycolicibacterium cyprinidarum TaxID=2860311 RepID=A0ABQ4V8C3_9MYCO|nr:hypothetical protein NGTWS1702_14550 [Mycolicibacterium sp. NGTWSNA01]GJF15645.1 hypothetical protein NGTWS0302_09710 [Mycolicibacterium sp. NGTWS0302]
MVAHPPPGAPEDGDRDDLAALDFSIGNEDGAEDDLGAILSGHLSDAAVEEARNDPDDDLAAAVFTVANPPGTVTVTTLIDGRVHQIELSPEAATLTETVLAEEIVVIADLATQDARSSQYACSTPRIPRGRPTGTMSATPCQPVGMSRYLRRPGRPRHRRHARPRSPARYRWRRSLALSRPLTMALCVLRKARFPRALAMSSSSPPRLRRQVRWPPPPRRPTILVTVGKLSDPSGSLRRHRRRRWVITVRSTRWHMLVSGVR